MSDTRALILLKIDIKRLQESTTRLASLQKKADKPRLGLTYRNRCLEAIERELRLIDILREDLATHLVASREEMV